MVGFTLDEGGATKAKKPRWLDTLLTERFFDPCARHNAEKKNETNMFCLDCVAGICQYCLPDHSLHQLLQIRRYVYHDVVRVHDLQKFLDCSKVQTYIINGARVVFVNERPQPKSTKGLNNNCQSCARNLQDAFLFCSVACKVDAVYKGGKVAIGKARTNITYISREQLKIKNREFETVTEEEQQDDVDRLSTSKPSELQFNNNYRSYGGGGSVSASVSSPPPKASYCRHDHSLIRGHNINAIAPSVCRTRTAPPDDRRCPIFTLKKLRSYHQHSAPVNPSSPRAVNLRLSFSACPASVAAAAALHRRKSKTPHRSPFC